jgi:hypothetical protein
MKHSLEKELDLAIDIIVSQDMTIQKQRALIADLLELNRMRKLENNQLRFLHMIQYQQMLVPSMN